MRAYLSIGIGLLICESLGCSSHPLRPSGTEAGLNETVLLATDVRRFSINVSANIRQQGVGDW